MTTSETNRTRHDGEAGVVIGVDLGGTYVRAGSVGPDGVRGVARSVVPVEGGVEAVIDVITRVISEVLSADTVQIGVGVPSVVDPDSGVVYDVQNIPAWTEVPLKRLLEERFDLPVSINNDANCFALAERDFGQGRVYDSFVGLITGTGMAAGIIVNGRLIEGAHCGAGEFGMLPYRDSIFEHYCSGQFFVRHHQLSGEQAALRAARGDAAAYEIFAEYGHHLGRAIQAILYTLDVRHIVLGGSVSRSFALFQEAMWSALQDFAFRRALDGLTIEVSGLEHAGVLGAASLCKESGARVASSSTMNTINR
jgi:glucokinase